MANESKTERTSENTEKRQPLFVGKYKRDSAVSEVEKAAEASRAIYEGLLKQIKKKAK